MEGGKGEVDCLAAARRAAGCARQRYRRVAKEPQVEVGRRVLTAPPCRHCLSDDITEAEELARRAHEHLPLHPEKQGVVGRSAKPRRAGMAGEAEAQCKTGCCAGTQGLPGPGEPA
mgnify:CR=1 FL=1